jgi:hypothetical protein
MSPVTPESKAQDLREELRATIMRLEDAVDEATRRVVNTMLTEGIAIKRELRAREADLRNVIPYSRNGDGR